MKTFRKNGAFGALLDEYEKAVIELQTVVGSVTNDELITIVDHETKDLNCRSIQTILNHVIGAGYRYVLEIRKYQGEPLNTLEPILFKTTSEYQSALGQMFRFNEKLFHDYPKLKLEEHDPAKKINVKWGQQYDVEQLLEHAVVHILRHRRQIERFIAILR